MNLLGKEEIRQYIINNWNSKTLEEIGRKVNLHYTKVAKIANEIGLKSKRQKQIEEKEVRLGFLKDRYSPFPEYPKDEINRHMVEFGMDRRSSEKDFLSVGLYKPKNVLSLEYKNFIMDNWEKINITSIADKLGITRGSVWKIAKSLELPKKDRKGKNSGKWKGGCTNTNKRILNAIRKSVDGYKWERDVKLRDKLTCQKCGKVGGRNKYYQIVGVTAHHIFNFYDNPDKRFDIDNGITMCIKCHEEFHDIYGWRKTNKYQIEEYLNGKQN